MKKLLIHRFTCLIWRQGLLQITQNLAPPNKPALPLDAKENDFMSNAKKILIIIYIIGVICVCFLLVRMLIGGNNIINPDAMLPLTYIESSSIILAIGSFPMCIVSYLLYREFINKKRFQIFIPSIITIFSLAYWIVVMGLGLINSFY